MYCTLYIQYKMKNKFATEGTTNISKKLAIREYINTKDHNNTEKLEKVRANGIFIKAIFFIWCTYKPCYWYNVSSLFFSKKEFTY